MATPDVPGANPANGDTLHDNCWAESAEDTKSLILVHQVEGNRVIFSIFDPSHDPCLEYRHAMTEADFKKQFSWAPGKQAGKWIWHDKSKFPWDRAIRFGLKEGVKVSTLDETLTHAQRLAEHFGLVAKEIDAKAMSEQSLSGASAAAGIGERIDKAIAAAMEAFTRK